MHEILLINVSGQDRPGLTVALAEALSRHEVTVLDMGQAVIHDNLAWGMLVEVPRSASEGPVYKDLLFTAHQLGLQLRITPVSEAEYGQWVQAQGQPRHIITLLGRQIAAHHIAGVARTVAAQNLNIDRIQRLSGRASLSTPIEARRAAIELTVSGTVTDLGAMRGGFLQLSRELEVDIAIQADDVFRRTRRLVCFDMDSTLVQTEMIDELAHAAGVGSAVQDITARAMAGELDFEQSFRERAGLLKGLDTAVMGDIAERMPLTEGAERLVTIQITKTTLVERAMPAANSVSVRTGKTNPLKTNNLRSLSPISLI